MKAYKRIVYILPFKFLLLVLYFFCLGCSEGTVEDLLNESSPQFGTASYQISYNANQETSGNAPIDFNSPYQAKKTVTALGNTNGLVRSGYSFAGWNTEENGSGTSYSAGVNFSMPHNDLFLYAQWIKNYTITFDSNGGTGDMSTLELAIGTTTDLPANTYTKVASTFAGWATSPSGAVTYNDKQSYTICGNNMTLYAIWVNSSALLLHYNFDEQDVKDSSGNENDGLAHDITYTADDSGGYSASLNGTSSSISLPDNIITENTEFTIMMRFKATSSQYGLLFGYQNGPLDTIVSHYVPVIGIRSDGKLRGELWIGSQLEVISEKSVNDGKWHTVYFSADSDSITLYLDGVDIGTSMGRVQHLDMSINQIGAGIATGRALMPDINELSNEWFYFDGLIDDFYFYDAAL